jgi:Xaa-Pro aminopeptidase
MNYGHGTGHGVGSYLNVHEGPQAISPLTGTQIPLQRGMVLSVEPGLYREGEYGIRIENLVYVEEDESRRWNGEAFLCFEPLTLCPIDRKLIDREILDDHEIDYLNEYHRRVWEALSPHLSGEVLSFLEEAIKPI